jgi:hypothetical protein
MPRAGKNCAFLIVTVGARTYAASMAGAPMRLFNMGELPWKREPYALGPTIIIGS